MSFSEHELNLTVKLTASRFEAVALPYTEETGYGLGKHGWITAKLPREGEVDIKMVRRWIDESFRANAPKALLKQLAK
jgi:predicted DNA-binding protein (MmcQ/YjbR family)